MICHSLSSASETDVLQLDPGTVDPAGPNPGGRFCVFSRWKHEIKTSHKEYTPGAALMLCNFSFMVSALTGIKWHHRGLDLCCEFAQLCLPLLQTHTVSHVSFYSISALNRDRRENCSHSTHMSSLTIPLTPFTIMRLVKGLFPNSFYPSLFILFYSL